MPTHSSILAWRIPDFFNEWASSMAAHFPFCPLNQHLGYIQGRPGHSERDSELLGESGVRCSPCRVGSIGPPLPAFIHLAIFTLFVRLGVSFSLLHSILWFKARILLCLCWISLTDTHRKPRLTRPFPKFLSYLNIYLLGYGSSWLRDLGFSIFIVSCRIFGCGIWDLVP